MIYAIRTNGHGRQTLAEFKSISAMSSATANIPVFGHGITMRLVDDEAAHEWVRNGLEHETGLWIDDDGVIQYAEAEAEEAKAEGEIHSPPGRSAPSIGSTPRIGLTSDGAREPNNETINLG